MRRPAPPRAIPPPLELECLKSLWRLGEASVKQVQEDLAPSRRLAYTTVMTLLDRLVRKGSATRRKEGRMFLYASALDRESVRGYAVRELLDSLFEGSLPQFLEFLGRRSDGVRASPAEPAPPGLDPTLL